MKGALLSSGSLVMASGVELSSGKRGHPIQTRTLGCAMISVVEASLWVGHAKEMKSCRSKCG